MVNSQIGLLLLLALSQAWVTGSNTGMVTFGAGQAGAGLNAAIARGSGSKRRGEIVSFICDI